LVIQIEDWHTNILHSTYSIYSSFYITTHFVSFKNFFCGRDMYTYRYIFTELIVFDTAIVMMESEAFATKSRFAFDWNCWKSILTRPKDHPTDISEPRKPLVELESWIKVHYCQCDQKRFEKRPTITFISL
jgi:hypothetical protein